MPGVEPFDFLKFEVTPRREHIPWEWQALSAVDEPAAARWIPPRPLAAVVYAMSTLVKTLFFGATVAGAIVVAVTVAEVLQ